MKNKMRENCSEMNPKSFLTSTATTMLCLHAIIISLHMIPSQAAAPPNLNPFQIEESRTDHFFASKLSSLEVSIQLATTTTSSVRCSSHLPSFRGGASPSPQNDDNEDSSQTSSSSSSLWGSITSAFQMNIDAKDELMQESNDDDKDDEDSDSATNSDSDEDVYDPIMNSGEHETGQEFIQENDDIDESSDEEDNDEVQISDVAPASSTFIKDKKNDDLSSDDDDLEILSEEEENENENENDDEDNKNDKEDGILMMEAIKEQIEDALEIEEIVESTDEEEDLDISVADSSFDGLQRVEYEEESGSDEDFNPDDVEQDNISVYTDISSTSDSELVHYEEEEGYFGLKDEDDMDYSTPLPTLEEIVREEWSMIPETEGEDEGRENEIEEEPRREKRKPKKKKKKDTDKKKKHDKKDRDRKVDAEKERIRAEEQGRLELTPEEALPPPTVAVTVEEKAVAATPEEQESPFISSGFVSNVYSFFIIELSRFLTIFALQWLTIDKVSSLGLSTSHQDLRLSRKLRKLRKTAAYYTGLHGFMSGKGRGFLSSEEKKGIGKDEEMNDADLGLIRRRIAAIEAARRRVASAAPDANAIRSAKRAAYANVPRWRRPFARMVRRPGNVTAAAISAPNDHPLLEGTSEQDEDNLPHEAYPSDPPRKPFMSEGEKEKVKDIDRMIQEGQRRILDLQTKKDELQRSPNPLYSYTTPTDTSDDSEDKEEKADPVADSRTFNFPSEKLVGEYIDELYSVGRLLKMNHTELWKRKSLYCDDDEEIGDDLLTPSGDASKLYENNERSKNGNGRRNGNGAGGSWLLRQSLGTGSKLGEKIGETIENAAYRGVCSAVMTILAKSIAALHGVNVMKHSDIRLFVESATDLPPVSKTIFQDNDYAKEAIGKAVRKGSKKKRKRKQKAYQYGSDSCDDSFVQRDAVVETLISHCQISAPLLKLFPPAWQRALLGNIITLIAAVVSDFAEGVQFQILGHQLAFSFKPITEADMIQHIGVGGFRFNHRRAKPEEFEAAVRATADDISQGLGFLDRWHERALGGDLLRAQIGNLIARVVLTLVDEVLHSARMDLWSAQVGGPRIVAGLEYRSDDDGGID